MNITNKLKWGVKMGIRVLPLFFVLLVILGLISLHQKLSTVYVWQSDVTHDYEELLTIVTYNIRYGKGVDGQVNLERTIATLKEMDAHIISLQEVERFSIRSKFRDQVNMLAKNLEMNALYYPSLAYPGIYYGNVILSRYPISGYTVLPFSNKGENRSAIIAKVTLPSLEEVYVINTHLGLDKTERHQAILEIKNFVRNLDKPFFIMGDLNSTPQMNEYKSWSQYVQKSNEGIPLQTFSNKDWQIDYIFYTPHFVVEHVAAHYSKASDHFPVIAMFRTIE